MQELILKIYHSMRNNYFGFRLAVRLKELGVNDYSKLLLGFWKKTVSLSDSDYREMEEARGFVGANRKRISRMLETLEDEKSRKVWKAAMRYRMKRTPIPHSLWSDTDQYFAKDIIHIGRDEVFIDGGGFIGDTIQHLYNFSKKGPGSIQKVVTFEPDPDNLEYLKKYFGKDNKVKIIPKGLSEKEGALNFLQSGSCGSFTDSDDNGGAIKTPVTNIDAVRECFGATFIKMDIEGSEMPALWGGN